MNKCEVRHLELTDEIVGKGKNNISQLVRITDINRISLKEETLNPAKVGKQQRDSEYLGSAGRVEKGEVAVRKVELLRLRETTGNNTEEGPASTI